MPPTPVLMSQGRPFGWKLEELLAQLIQEIEAKSTKISADDTQIAQAVLANNQAIIRHLTLALQYQQASYRMLARLGPDQGPLGAPRIGAVAPAHSGGDDIIVMGTDPGTAERTLLLTTPGTSQSEMEARLAELGESAALQDTLDRLDAHGVARIDTLVHRGPPAAVVPIPTAIGATTTTPLAQVSISEYEAAGSSEVYTGVSMTAFAVPPPGEGMATATFAGGQRVEKP